MENEPQNNPKNANPALWIVLAIVVIIAAAGFIYYWQTTNSDTNRNAANTNAEANANIVANTNSTNNPNITAGNQRFVTTDYSFQAPANLYILNHQDSGAVELSRASKLQQGSYADTFLIIREDQKAPSQVDGVDVLLDAKPSATTTVQGHQTNIYRFPNGYEGTPAFMVYRVKVGATYFRFDFWNTNEETTEISALVSSLIFTK